MAGMHLINDVKVYSELLSIFDKYHAMQCPPHVYELHD